MGDWTGFLFQIVLFAALAAVLFGGMAGYVLAGPARLNPWLGTALGALAPVAGVAGLGVTALVRYRRNPARTGSRWWVKTRGGAWALAGLAVLLVPLLLASAMGWFVLKVPGLTLIRFGTADPLVGAVIGASLVTLVAAGLCSLRAPSRLGGLLVAWSGIWCLFIAALALAVTRPMAALTGTLASLNYTVGDLMALVSGDGPAGELPPLLDDVLDRVSIDPAALTGFDMAAALPELRFVVGPGILALLAFAIGSVLWSLLMFALAGAESRRTRQTAGTAAPAPIVAQAPAPPGPVDGAVHPFYPPPPVRDDGFWDPRT